VGQCHWQVVDLAPFRSQRMQMQNFVITLALGRAFSCLMEPKSFTRLGRGLDSSRNFFCVLLSVLVVWLFIAALSARMCESQKCFQLDAESRLTFLVRDSFVCRAFCLAVDASLILSVLTFSLCRQERHGMKEPNQFDDIVSATNSTFTHRKVLSGPANSRQQSRVKQPKVSASGDRIKARPWPWH
jgi:hypothetical protein